MENNEPLFLIVDDEPDMCWALEHILKKHGFQSEKAFSGREAMTLVKPDKFHTVFLDIKLPDMEGLELARLIKSVDPAVRIVMISGFCYRDDPIVQNALQEDLICCFIAKPFLHGEIIDSITATRCLNSGSCGSQ